MSYVKAQAMCKEDRKSFSRLKSALLENGVITCDNVCKFGKKAFHYTLGPAMKGTVWTLSNHQEEFTLPVYGIGQGVTLKDLTIDLMLLDAALKSTAEARGWDQKRTEFWRWQLTDGWNNEVHKSKHGRVFGTWSRVPRELRGLFLIKGKPTVEVDIKNAQPTFLVNLYKDKCLPECQKFIEKIAAGEFYEYIMEKTELKEREDVKRLCMSFLCGKVKSNPELLGFFRKEFPTLLLRILEKLASNYRSLAWWLQQQESAIIVQGICSKFPVFSMHDGVICEESMREEVKKATEKALFDVCGIHGKVVIEDKREQLLNAIAPKAA